MQFRLLQYLLYALGLSFGICLLGVVLPWKWIEAALRNFGAWEWVYDPMLEYWVRMTSGVFGMIGILFFRFGIQPRRYLKAIRVSGWFMALEGGILTYYGLHLDLPHFPVFYDALACLATGLGILYLTKETQMSQGEQG